MSHHQFLRIPLSLLLLGCCISQAQETGTDKPKKATGRTAWFVATSIPDGLENPVSVASGTEIVKVTLSKRAASEAVKIPADGILRIVRKVENPKDPSKPAYLTLAQAMVPEGVNKALVILGTAPKKPGSDLVFLSKVQDLAHFKGGDYMFMNLSTLNISVQLGEKKIGLKPGDSSIYDGGSPAAPVNQPVSYRFFDDTKKEWKLISASTVVVQATRREMCIFSWDPDYDRVDYLGITVPVIADPSNGG